MCLILFAWRAHPRYPLLVAANRDEFHRRPSAAAEFWNDVPGVLAGRDLECTGTWLGVTRAGRFAAITNYRDMSDPREGARSRGLIAREYLAEDGAPSEAVSRLARSGDDYRGFNLLAADQREFWWLSNRDPGPRRLEAGVYGLSNHLLETPWPKVSRGKARLTDVVASGAVSIGALLGVVSDETPAPDDELAHADPDPSRERMLSAAKIVSSEYGTRCSTAIAIDSDGRVQFAERRYEPSGAEIDTRRFEFTLAEAAS